MTMSYLLCKAACAALDTVSRWHLRWQVHRAIRHPRLRAAARAELEASGRRRQP